MSCNTCAKSFSILRKERGCPGCGFSYCSKCLSHKVFLSKLNAETKVCGKCQMGQNDQSTKGAIEPPAAYLKRLELLDDPSWPPITMYEQDKYQKLKSGLAAEDQQIVERLHHLKEDQVAAPSSESVEKQITERLKRLRGIDANNTTDDEVRTRLSNLKGEPVPQSSKAVPIAADLRTDQQKSDDLIRQYMQEIGIDKSHNEAFDSRIGDIESRLHALTGSRPIAEGRGSASESEDEEEIVRKVIEKAKAEAALEQLTPEVAAANDPAMQELPWCEICNEDAHMRCLGCRYLFCKQCYLEHKDDDLGCDRYEPYQKPTNKPA